MGRKPETEDGDVRDEIEGGKATVSPDAYAIQGFVSSATPTLENLMQSDNLAPLWSS